jgi:type III secretory pathway component EscU
LLLLLALAACSLLALLLVLATISVLIILRKINKYGQVFSEKKVEKKRR